VVNLAVGMRVVRTLDDSMFASPLSISVDEGYTFVQKLADEFVSDVNRFDAPGALLLAVYEDETMIAVGGVHPDPYLLGDNVGRIRHVYVLPDQRRSGVGRRLAAFYQALGFNDQPRFADATHWMSLKTDFIG